MEFLIAFGLAISGLYLVIEMIRKGLLWTWFGFVILFIEIGLIMFSIMSFVFWLGTL